MEGSLKRGEDLKKFFTKNGLLVLAMTALLSVLLAVTSLFGGTGLFQNAAGFLTYPFRAGYHAVTQRLEDLRQHYADYSALEEQVAALEKQVAELEATVRQSESDREENARLRDLAGLRAQRRDFVFESAEILSRDSSNWTDALTLNCGTAQDVALGDCVITQTGDLVGEVSQVGTNWCTVQTICDTDTELGARIFRTGALAIAEGDFELMAQQELRLSYLSTDTQLLVGDLIVTSGLGGYYPSGLVLGSVRSIHSDDSGTADYAIVTPAADLSELSQVFVIKDFTVVE